MSPVQPMAHGRIGFSGGGDVAKAPEEKLHPPTGGKSEIADAYMPLQIFSRISRDRHDDCGAYALNEGGWEGGTLPKGFSCFPCDAATERKTLAVSTSKGCLPEGGHWAKQADISSENIR